MNKNDYFYDFFNKCQKETGEKKFKKYKLELIDVFSEKLGKILKFKRS